MANYKTGFDFYNTDTDRYQDRRIKRLKKQYKCDGLAVYDFVLCEIYRVKGSYIEWDEDARFDVAEYFDLADERVQEIVDFCCNIGLFDKNIFEIYNILTSRSIQQRYSETCIRAKRQGWSIPENISLLNNNTESDILPEECPIIPEESAKVPEFSNRVEYSIVENSKEEYLSDACAPEERERIFEIFLFDKKLKNPKIEVDRFWEHYTAQGWKTAKGIPITNRIAKAKGWDATGKSTIDEKTITAWRGLYNAVRGAPGRIVMLEGFENLKITDKAIELHCDKELPPFIESHVKQLNQEFRKHFGDKKLTYRVK